MPEANMKPDQERVKNLLTDTVTLLCKNGLTFSNKLRIEGLLGVSIDDKDVFFVHISENFQNPVEPVEEETAESPVFTAPESPAKSSRRVRQSPSPSRTSSPAAFVKAEPGDDSDELLIVEEPKLEIFERSRTAGGQRRGRRKDQSPSQGWDDMGEPLAKRHMSTDEDENGSGYGDQGGWPDLSGVGEDYNQGGQVYQQDPGGSSFDSTSPGCSTWPMTLATQQQSQDSITSQLKKLPENALTSGAVRNGLAEFLVKPLHRDDRRYLAFRLMWNSKHLGEVDSIWNNITYYQQEICSQLKCVEGVTFFLSDITATTTRATRVVHPGIAFWVAVNPQIASEIQIYTAMRNNSFSAELKLMTNTQSDIIETDRQVKNVGLAVKDFGPGYVQSRVNSALGPNNQYFRERFFLKQGPESKMYKDVILVAQQGLSELGLHLHVETF